MNHFEVGFEKVAWSPKGFLNSFRKSKALVVGGARGAESLPSEEHLVGTLGRYVKRKTGIGGGIGAVGGGALGAATAEGENGKGPTTGQRIGRGLLGAAGGAGIGALGGHIYGTAKAMPHFMQHAEIKKGLVGAKDKEGKTTFEYFKRTANKAHDMADDIAEHMGPVSHQTMFGHTRVMRGKDLADTIRGLKRESESMMPFLADIDKRDRITAGHLLSGIEKARERAGVASQGIGKHLDDLRMQGITDHKAFAKKYHPDVNPNAPKHIKDNFNAIHSALKGGHTGEPQGGFDRLYKALHDEDQATIRGFNSKLYALTEGR